MEQSLSQGRHAIISSSRSVIGQAQLFFGDQRVVTIEVDADIAKVRQRLLLRGRENREQIDQRLEHNSHMSQSVKQTAKHLVVVHNNGTVEQGVSQFLQALFLVHQQKK